MQEKGQALCVCMRVLQRAVEMLLSKMEWEGRYLWRSYRRYILSHG